MNDYNNGYMAPIPSNMQNNYNPDISQNQIPNGIAFLNQENVSNIMATCQQNGILINQNQNLMLQNQNLILQNQNYCNQIMQMSDYINRLQSEYANFTRRFSVRDHQWLSIESPRKAITIGFFELKSITAVLIEDQNSVYKKYLYVVYQSSKTDSCAFIPWKDFQAKKIFKFFSDFYPEESCSKSLANTFLTYLFSQYPPSKISTVQVHYHPGFYLHSNCNKKYKSDISFECIDYKKMMSIQDIYNELSDYMKYKRLLCYQDTPSSLKEEASYIASNQELMFLTAFRTAGLLSVIFDTLIRINISNILVINPGEKTNHKIFEKYISFLSVFRRPDSHPLHLTKTEITKILEHSRSETVIFSDYQTSNIKKRNNAIELINSFFHTLKCQEKMNVAIISNSAEHIIHSEDMLVLKPNTETEILVNDMVEYNEMIDSCTINFIISNSDHAVDFLIEKVQKYQKRYSESICTDTYLNLFAMIMACVELFRFLFDIEMNIQVFEDYIIHIIEDNLKEQKEPLDILNDFSRVLNNQIQNNTLQFKEVSSHMNYSEDSNIIIVKNDILSIRGSIIESTILPYMSTTDKLVHVQNALKENGLLVCNKDLQNALTVYDKNGNPVVKRFISFQNRNQFYSLIQESNELKLLFLPMQDYFSACQDYPEHFLPLLHNEENKVAGIYRRPELAENNHIFVTGCSGQGKTYFLCQLIYLFYHDNKKIVVFDTSNSFAKSTLENYISKDFVENSIAYYTADEDSIPINIWDMSLYKSHINKKRYISSLILSVFQTVTANQRTAINSAISKILHEDKVVAETDIFDISKFTEILKNESDGNVISNIVETIESLNGELTDYGVDHGLTWEEVLSENKIVIISFPYDATGNVNNITDMLLASLYQYQNNFMRYDLRIFVDEIQKQNLEEKSPIYTILTEGRKFKIGLNFASQFVLNRVTSKNQMKNNTFLTVYFKPDEVSEKAVIERLDLNAMQKELLSKFKPGDCFIKGSIYNFRTKVNDNAIIYGKIIKQTKI